MGTRQVGLPDVKQGGRSGSRLRLLAPIRYLFIWHPEKTNYDFKLPLVIAAVVWSAFELITPHIPIFGDAGALRYSRDLLIMGVPFMIGALAAVAMGAPGPQLDRRPVGSDLLLSDRPLTMRQFLCYLLGYLSFLGLIILIGSVFAQLLHDPVKHWAVSHPDLGRIFYNGGVLGFITLNSFLSITVFWSLYFLTDLVNRD